MEGQLMCQLSRRSSQLTDNSNSRLQFKKVNPEQDRKCFTFLMEAFPPLTKQLGEERQSKFHGPFSLVAVSICRTKIPLKDKLNCQKWWNACNKSAEHEKLASSFATNCQKYATFLQNGGTFSAIQICNYHVNGPLIYSHVPAVIIVSWSKKHLSGFFL